MIPHVTMTLVFIALAGAIALPAVTVEAPQPPIFFRGKTIVYRSSLYPQVIAFHLDEGNVGAYGSAAEVRGWSDLGRDLEPCGDGIDTCIDLSGIYLMVPPKGGGLWKKGDSDFRLVPERPGRDGQVVVVTRRGEWMHSYNYSPRCGIGWIRFSPEETFSPVAEALLSSPDCAPKPGA